MDDWLSQLRQIREEDEKQFAETTAPEQPETAQVEQLLKASKAFESLRDIRKVLLGGIGRIERLENAGGYDVVLALTWNGPVSAPKKPEAESLGMRHIFIAVHKNRLWVNGQPVPANTPQALQASLLQAARNPGRRQELQRPKR